MVSPRPQNSRAVDLAAVAAAVGAVTSGGSPTPVAGVSLDSRTVRPGDLYAALPGARAHGARFAAAARDAGAVAVLTDQDGAALLDEAGIDLPRVVTPRPRAVLGTVAALVYGTASLPLAMVGITGTNGKTTTAYLLTSALAALGRSSGLIGTIETRIGDERIRSVRTTPEMTDLHALLAVMVERGMQSCVMEVSSHALSQHRVDGVFYDVAVFTNLSRDHLDYHTTMEDYYLAKASLFTPERAARAVVCTDDPWGVRLADECRIPVETLSSREGVDADWRVVPDPAHPSAFTLTGKDVTMTLRSALPGDFNRVNTALAAVTLLAVGEEPDDVERAVLADPHVPGRMETVTPSGYGGTAAPPSAPLAVVDYAHTPDAVEAALTSLRSTTTGALVVVLGAGGDRDREKRPAMGAAAARCADVVVVTDDNPRSEDPAEIRATLLAGARDEHARGEVRDVAGRRPAITYAVQRAFASGPGSTVVVLGKGHETGQEVDGTVHPFDDRQELRRALDEALLGTGASIGNGVAPPDVPAEDVPAEDVPAGTEGSSGTATGRDR